MSGARRTARRRRRGLRTGLRTIAFLLAFVVVFGLGIGLGEALHDNPRPGGTQTLIRTLRPLPLVPVAQNTVTEETTVTITTSNP